MKLVRKLNKGLMLVIKQFARIIAFAWPRKKSLVVVGGWCGELYNDSPKYLTLYLLENSTCEIVWIGKDHIRAQLPSHPRLHFALKGSLSAALALLRAKVWVCCISLEWDLTTWPLEGRALLINTGHGEGMKASGGGTGVQRKLMRKPSFLGRIAQSLQRHRRPIRLVGCETAVEAILKGDVNGVYYKASRMLRIGTPTNDYLINNRKNAQLIRELRVKYATMLGFDADQKIVVYMPTWRNPGVAVKSFYGLSEADQIQWRDMLKHHSAVLIEKHHFRTLESFPVGKQSICSIAVSMDIQKKMDVNELLLITDVLISDYSGAYQDFGVLERPCIHFMYDLEDYLENCSGLCDGWENVVAGPIVKTDQKLFELVDRYLSNPQFEPAAGYAKSREYQTGHSCEKLLDLIKEGVW